ncbi:MAG: hypothetical protein IPL04_08730 [Chitinophagaceae bacterium]|nr:hypothetical protein [Chitinophagaceae bacterium]
MKKLLIICLPLLLLMSCKKEVSELPPATQTGANTFGAKVNGNFWIPQGFGPVPASNLLEAIRLGPNFYIRARNFASSPNETEFEIFIKDLTGPGTYPLNTTMASRSTAASYGFYLKRNLTPISEWLTSATNSGSVTVTFMDTTNNILSGTFQFTAADVYGTGGPITVSEGRFDVRY